jgi:outer membrane protein assembly factor BamE (lipoprotein component of BamABCDE complex)
MRLQPSSLLIFILLACSGPSPSFEGIDWTVWKEDADACKNQRAQYIEPLSRQLGKLKGLSEMEVVKLMGKPDQNELYKRNQKFYHYFLKPGLPCAKSDSGVSKLTVRFNAIGLAKEVSIE